MRWSVIPLVLVTACAEPNVPLPEPEPEVPFNPMNPPSNPNGRPTRQPQPDRYFVATASMPYLHRIYMADGLEPRRLTPLRGAGYGRGDGSLFFVGVTPAERLAVVRFTSVSPDVPDALFAVSADGVSVDAPILIAQDVGTIHNVTMDEARMAFVANGSLRVVRLDGSDAHDTRRLAIPTAERVVQLHLTAAQLIAETVSDLSLRSSVLAFDLEDPVSPPQRWEPDPAAFEGSQLLGVLPDGRAFVRAGSRLFVVEPDGVATVVPFPPVSGLVSLLDTSADGRAALLAYRTLGVTRIVLLRLDEVPFEVRERMEVPDILAFDVSDDFRSIFVLAFDPDEGDQLVFHASTYAGPASRLAVMPLRVPRKIVSTRDGRSVVLCADQDLWAVGLGGEVTEFRDGCFRRNLLGLDSTNTHALLAGSPGFVGVSLDDGSEITVAHEGGPFDVLSDGAVALVSGDGESTIYRMDASRRVEPLLPWTSPPIESTHLVDEERLVVRRGDRWSVVDLDRAEEELVAVRRDARFVAVAAEHLILQDADGIASHPLDGTLTQGSLRSTANTVGQPIAVTDDQIVWGWGPSVLSVPVDAAAPAEPAEIYSLSNNAWIERIAVEPETGHVLLVIRVVARVTVAALPAAGGALVTHAAELPISNNANLESIDFSPDRSRVLLSFDNVARGRLTAALVMSIPLRGLAVTNFDRVGSELSELWGRPLPFYGSEIAVVGENGIELSSYTGGETRLVHPTRLFRQPGALGSPNGAWLLGRDSRGLHAFSPLGAAEPIQIAELVGDVAFTPTSELLLVVPDPETGNTMLISTTIGAEEGTVLTPPSFSVSGIVRADEDGVQLTSIDGGDFSHYFLPYGETYPIPITPIDDATEQEIQPTVSW